MKVDFKWNMESVFAVLRSRQKKGLEAAAVYLVARIQDVLSIWAPHAKMKNPRNVKGCMAYFRATTKARYMAPPRLLNGCLKKSIKYKLVDAGSSKMVARVGTELFYGRIHEAGKSGLGRGRHPFIWPTVNKEKQRLLEIIAKAGQQWLSWSG